MFLKILSYHLIIGPSRYPKQAFEDHLRLLEPNHGAFLCRFLGFLKALVIVNFKFQTARSPLFLATKTMTMDQVSEGFWVKYFLGLASLWIRNILHSCLNQNERSHLCQSGLNAKGKREPDKPQLFQIRHVYTPSRAVNYSSISSMVWL